MRRSLIQVGFGCFVFSLLVVPAHGASVGSGLGLNVHLLARFESSEWNAAAEELDTLGDTWAREQISWNTVEPQDDSFDFEELDQVMDAYADNDLHVLGLLTYSADWASSQPESDEARFYPPENTSDWLDFVSQVVNRYEDQVNAWEIWNEPNHTGFWKPSPDASAYAEFLAATADEIHAIDPGAKVVLGGLSGVDTDFLDQVYQEIGTGKFDVVALHPYRNALDSQNWTPEESVDGLLPLVNELSAARAVMRRYGDGNTPIWLTEFGWSTGSGGVTETQQKQYLARQTALALSLPKVQKVFWYAFQDGSTGNSLEDNYGITQTGGDRKSAARMLRFFDQELSAAQQVTGGPEQLGTTAVSLDPDEWNITQAEHASGTLEAADGSLTMQYVFVDAENSYVIYQQEQSLPISSQVLSFVAQGDNSKNVLRFRVVDTAGETFQYNVGSLSSDELTYQRDLTEWDFHFGGDEDGNLDQPVKFQSFVIDDSPDNASGTGSVIVSSIRTGAYGDFLTAYLTPKENGVQERYLVWTTQEKHIVSIQLNATKIRYKGIKNSQVLTSNTGQFNLVIRKTPKVIIVLE